MTFVALPLESDVLYSQIGLRLVDDFSGREPGYPVTAELEYEGGTGNWQRTGVTPIVTPSGVLSFPGLGRSVDATVAATVRHRVHLRSLHYRPEYLRTVDGLEFDVHPYDMNNPPPGVSGLPDSALLLPAPGYSFPGGVRFIRGQTVNGLGDPIAHVEVTQGALERSLSDEAGVFVLALRWPPLTGAVLIDAVDHRGVRAGNIVINLPGDLSQGHTITLI